MNARGTTGVAGDTQAVALAASLIIVYSSIMIENRRESARSVRRQHGPKFVLDKDLPVPLEQTGASICESVGRGFEPRPPHSISV
jgi:hypothetical protein